MNPKESRLPKIINLIDKVQNLMVRGSLVIYSNEPELKKRKVLEDAEESAFSYGLVMSLTGDQENPLKVFTSEEYAAKLTGLDDPKAGCLIGRIHMLKTYGEKPIDRLWYLLCLDRFYSTAAYREIKLKEFEAHLPSILSALTEESFLGSLLISKTDERAALHREHNDKIEVIDNFIYPHQHPVHIVIRLFEAYLTNLLGEKRYHEVGSFLAEISDLRLFEGLCGNLVHYFDYSAQKDFGIHFLEDQIKINQEQILPIRNLTLALKNLKECKARTTPKELKLIKRVQTERTQLDTESLLLYRKK
jgi:hypothetical protein